MVEAITKIDKSGRVVIPKEIRQRAHLTEDTALLVTDTSGQIVVLKKLDVKELANRLRQELKGVDVEAIGRRIEDESNERARKQHKALRRGH
ncbi:MAG: AbrB/MazE/SpoVT family DNA-binding domain-containing protein [Nitrososphaerales archaeon]